MRCLHGLIDDGQIELVIYNEFIIQSGDFWKQPWARTISESLVSFGVALNHLWSDCNLDNFRYSKLEEIILKNSDQTRICTLDVEQNGKLFFHGYEIDPEMEYLYAAECHTENKFCCIMRPRDKLRRYKTKYVHIDRLELEISYKRPGEGLESLAKWCQIANETVTFDLDMMGLQTENFNHIYQEPFWKFKLSRSIGAPTLECPIRY